MSLGGATQECISVLFCIGNGSGFQNICIFNAGMSSLQCVGQSFFVAKVEISFPWRFYIIQRYLCKDKYSHTIYNQIGISESLANYTENKLVYFNLICFKQTEVRGESYFVLSSRRESSTHA